MSKTPLTDKEAWWSHDESNEVVRSEVSRKLEADRAELVEALKAMFGDGYCEGGSFASQDFVPKSATAAARALLERIGK